MARQPSSCAGFATRCVHAAPDPQPQLGLPVAMDVEAAVTCGSPAKMNSIASLESFERSHVPAVRARFQPGQGSEASNRRGCIAMLVVATLFVGLTAVAVFSALWADPHPQHVAASLTGTAGTVSHADANPPTVLIVSLGAFGVVWCSLSASLNQSVSWPLLNATADSRRWLPMGLHAPSGHTSP